MLCMLCLVSFLPHRQLDYANPVAPCHAVCDRVSPAQLNSANSTMQLLMQQQNSHKIYCASRALLLENLLWFSVFLTDHVKHQTSSCSIKIVLAVQ